MKPKRFETVPLIKPRIECVCQPVTCTISAIGAPFLRCSKARMRPFLLPSRAAACLGFAAFFTAVLVVDLRAAFWPLAAPFRALAFLGGLALAGAAGAPCGAAFGVVVASGVTGAAVWLVVAFMPVEAGASIVAALRLACFVGFGI